MSKLARLLGFVTCLALQAKFAAERLLQGVGENFTIFDAIFGMKEATLGEVGVLLTDDFFLLFLIGLILAWFSSSVDGYHRSGGCRSLGRCFLGWLKTFDDSKGEAQNDSWNRIISKILFHLDQEERSVLDCAVEILVIEG